MRKLLYLALLCLCLPLAAHAEDEEPQPKPEPIYVKLGPSLVSNLNGGPKYIRCEVQLMVHGEEHQALLEKYLPALRHELFLLLVEQDGRALQTPQGKEALRQSAIAAMRQVMQAHTGQPVVEDLYFTSYYVQ